MEILKSSERPNSIECLGNQTAFNWDIVLIHPETIDEQEQPDYYEFKQIRIDVPKVFATANMFIKVAVKSLANIDEESNWQNNFAETGEKSPEYEAFLTERRRLKELIKTACIEANIPLN